MERQDAGAAGGGRVETSERASQPTPSGEQQPQQRWSLAASDRQFIVAPSFLLFPRSFCSPHFAQQHSLFLVRGHDRLKEKRLWAVEN